MLRLAGEIADGVILWLCNPNYIRDVVVPTVTRGAREGRQGRSTGSTSSRPCRRPSRTTRTAAREQLRSDLVPYFHLPYYRAMIERSGFDPDDGATDEFIRLLAAIGPADEAIESVRRYRDCGATSPCVGVISGTDFDATLEALARASTSQRPPWRRSRSSSLTRAWPLASVWTLTVARFPSTSIASISMLGRSTPPAAERSWRAHSSPPARLRRLRGEELVADRGEVPLRHRALQSVDRRGHLRRGLRRPVVASSSPPREQPDGARA